jgi:O-ureido-D-serine cyclo-ligase
VTSQPGAATVALVTAATAEALDDDLPPLADALRRRSVEPTIVDWHDASVPWATFDLAVVRSTWDYTWHLDAFLAWVRDVSRVTTLANPADIVRWSTDKRYLVALARAGVPVVPTAVLEPERPFDAAWHAALEGVEPDGDLVVKPVVSAGARDTERFRPSDRDAAVAHARQLLDAGRAVMVQPYLDAVDERGETGTVFLGDRFSHAFRKGALLGHGAELVDGLYLAEQIGPATVSADERAVAEAALDAISSCVPGRSRHDLLYARVDLVPGPDGPVVLELELVEPSLFLATDPAAADRAADAIVAALDHNRRARTAPDHPTPQ